MIEVVIYVRVSTNRQQWSQTLEHQLARLREWVTAQTDWHLAEAHIYRDDGYSGAKLNRPGLDALCDRAALGVFARVSAPPPNPWGRGGICTHADRQAHAPGALSQNPQ